MKENQFLEEFSKRDMYFKNSFEDMVFRSDLKSKKYYCKIRGKAEFEVKKGSRTFADATLEMNEITKEEYNGF